MNTLNDRRAWPLHWYQTLNASQSNWNISLETQNFIDSYYPSSISGLSVTEHRDLRATGPQAPKTYFSYENWTSVPKTLRYSLHEYRTYVLLHECGHALGQGHRRCTGGPAPIMLQQTRGLGECTKNIWPLEKELKDVEKKYIFTYL
jgi:hypothetical protein